MLERIATENEITDREGVRDKVNDPEIPRWMYVSITLDQLQHDVAADIMEHVWKPCEHQRHPGKVTAGNVKHGAYIVRQDDVFQDATGACRHLIVDPPPERCVSPQRYSCMMVVNTCLRS